MILLFEYKSLINEALSLLAEKVILMYENAIKKEPTNEELLTHLFMAYVRIGEYKKQQSIGLQLYKATQKSPYYYWSVMSAMLQVHCYLVNVIKLGIFQK